MVDDASLDLVKQSLLIALKIAGPVLAAGVVVGLVISIVQSVTSIQEQTLALIPKIIAMVVVIIALLPWILVRLADFAVQMFSLA